MGANGASSLALIPTRHILLFLYGLTVDPQGNVWSVGSYGAYTPPTSHSLVLRYASGNPFLDVTYKDYYYMRFDICIVWGRSRATAIAHSTHLKTPPGRSYAKSLYWRRAYP